MITRRIESRLTQTSDFLIILPPLIACCATCAPTNIASPPFSPTSRSRASPSTKVDQNRDEDDDADNDLLDETRDTENVEPIRQHADQNEAESRTDHGSPAAK